jgi:hypothetical protein
MVGVCRVNCPLGREKGCRRPPTVFGGGGGTRWEANVSDTVQEITGKIIIRNSNDQLFRA